MRLVKWVDGIQPKRDRQLQPRLLAIAFDGAAQASTGRWRIQERRNEGFLFAASELNEFLLLHDAGGCLLCASTTSSLKVRPVNAAARWKRSFCALDTRASNRALRLFGRDSGVVRKVLLSLIR